MDRTIRPNSNFTVNRRNLIDLGNLNRTSESFNAALLASTPVSGNLTNLVFTNAVLTWNGTECE